MSRASTWPGWAGRWKYIRAGDIYQVNLTQRFSAPCEADARAVYLAPGG